jgi:hypothetical protein
VVSILTQPTPRPKELSQVLDSKVLSIQCETPTVAYTAAQIDNRLRTGISRSLAPELPNWFHDEI